MARKTSAAARAAAKRKGFKWPSLYGSMYAVKYDKKNKKEMGGGVSEDYIYSSHLGVAQDLTKKLARLGLKNAVRTYKGNTHEQGGIDIDENMMPIRGGKTNRQSSYKYGGDPVVELEEDEITIDYDALNSSQDEIAKNTANFIIAEEQARNDMLRMAAMGESENIMQLGGSIDPPFGTAPFPQNPFMSSNMNSSGGTYMSYSPTYAPVAYKPYTSPVPEMRDRIIEDQAFANQATNEVFDAINLYNEEPAVAAAANQAYDQRASREGMEAMREYDQMLAAMRNEEAAYEQWMFNQAQSMRGVGADEQYNPFTPDASIEYDPVEQSRINRATQAQQSRAAQSRQISSLGPSEVDNFTFPNESFPDEELARLIAQPSTPANQSSIIETYNQALRDGTLSELPSTASTQYATPTPGTDAQQQAQGFNFSGTDLLGNSLAMALGIGTRIGSMVPRILRGPEQETPRFNRFNPRIRDLARSSVDFNPARRTAINQANAARANTRSANVNRALDANINASLNRNLQQVDFSEQQELVRRDQSIIQALASTGTQEAQIQREIDVANLQNQAAYDAAFESLGVAGLEIAKFVNNLGVEQKNFQTTNDLLKVAYNNINVQVGVDGRINYGAMTENQQRMLDNFDKALETQSAENQREIILGIEDPEMRKAYMKKYNITG